MAFGSDANTKSASLILPRVGHVLLIVLLCRHFAVLSSLSVYGLVTQFVAGGRNRLQGFKLRPCSGILLRDSTCLRFVQQGSQLTCACSVQARVISAY